MTQAGHKPALNAGQIWNMSFGFLGIQIGFELQNGNVSRIFQTLGADVGELAILWIAAPMTGLIVQPIIGHLSDKTWSPRFGRRRPYFLIGALLASLALFVMPNAPALWVAAGMLWIMDASLNITMEPFRAFVGDNLPDRQRTKGYAMQSFFIGTGAVLAGALPWVMTNWLGLSNVAPAGEIPATVQWSFYIGGAALLAAVAWTVFTTKEYSPQELASFEAARADTPRNSAGAAARTAAQFTGGGMLWVIAGLAIAALVAFARSESGAAMLGPIEIAKDIYVLAALVAGFGIIQLIAGSLRKQGREDSGFMEVVSDLFAMPRTMRQLAVVQFFSWFAMFALWIYGTPGVTEYHFGASDAASAAYQDGADWWSLMGSVRGAAGFAAMLLVRDPAMLWIPQIGIGIAWASIVSLPYAILAGCVPAEKMGIYMGVFNIFIVVPQLLAATLLGFLVTNLFGGAAIYAFVIAAVSFVLAAAATLLVQEQAA
ncbi:MAG: MFS transporter [Sphingomonadales bacterium]|nr:MAG: MFS transporter [Sphingomonadales bacterium]